jgi:hypothetical protein
LRARILTAILAAAARPEGPLDTDRRSRRSMGVGRVSPRDRGAHGRRPRLPRPER